MYKVHSPPEQTSVSYDWWAGYSRQMKRTMYSSQRVNYCMHFLEVGNQLLVKTVLHTRCYVFYRRFLVTHYWHSSINAFRKDVCLRPGLQALLSPYPNVALINFDQSVWLRASEKCWSVSSLIVSCSACNPSSRLDYMFFCQSEGHITVSFSSLLSPTSVVPFIDLKSAFDVANRDIILDQLVDFGVKGNLLRWIRSYLSNRRVRVLYRGACSSFKSFDLGIPQGGVLSPFLLNGVSQTMDVPQYTSCRLFNLANASALHHYTLMTKHNIHL